MRVAFEPGAVLRAAGEVDQLDLWAHRQVLNDLAVIRPGCEQGHDVRVKARSAQTVAPDASRYGECQDRARMWLDDHRVAGRKISEQARIAVPCWKRAAAEHEAGAARDNREALLHRERRGFALRVFPLRVRGDRADVVL